jgi:chorismate mutase/prephenate dehydratase
MGTTSPEKRPGLTTASRQTAKHMKSLNEIRQEIDGVDAGIARLFRRRMELVAEIADAKRAMGTAVTDPGREREIADKAAEAVGEEFADDVRRLYDAIFDISRNRQRRVQGA